MVRAPLLSTVLFLSLLALPTEASARSSVEVPYRFEQVWGAAVRLLRVDYRFPIRDRDEEIGYVLFDYTERGRGYQGSVELVPGEDPHGRANVRIVVQIPSMPGYIEQMILDRLRRKLRDDFGLPAPPPRPEPEPEPAERAEPEGEEAAQEGE